MWINMVLYGIISYVCYNEMYMTYPALWHILDNFKVYMNMSVNVTCMHQVEHESVVYCCHFLTWLFP